MQWNKVEARAHAHVVGISLIEGRDVLGVISMAEVVPVNSDGEGAY